METLKLPVHANVNWDYDKEADVLYIFFGQPRPAITVDMGCGIFARYEETTEEMVGLTIVGAKQVIQNESIELPDSHNSNK
jgi:uncharacterized protein YuzE